MTKNFDQIINAWTAKPVLCPVCGQPMEANLAVLAHKAPMSDPGKFAKADMPDDLKEALLDNGFNPDAFYLHDGAIEVLAIVVDDKDNILFKLQPARDRGRFGGWLITADTGDLVEAREAIEKYGWLWQDFVPDRIKNKESDHGNQ